MINRLVTELMTLTFV